MVADDQPANRELLEELLTTQGFKVISAPDGAAALDKVGTIRHHLCAEARTFGLSKLGALGKSLGEAIRGCRSAMNEPVGLEPVGLWCG